MLSLTQGVVNVVMGDAADIGETLLASSQVFESSNFLSSSILL